MDTLVDPSEQPNARRSSSRMRADAPRNTLPSVADAEVEWFARTGAFPRSTPTPPPLPHDRVNARFDRHSGRLVESGELEEAHLDEDALEDDDDDALAEDVALDSFSMKAERSTEADGSTEADRSSEGDRSDDMSDPENDTLVLATRRFVRARIWSSED